MCRIPIKVNYTSALQITAATASYKISGSSAYTTVNVLPDIDGTITLPDIKTSGNYELIIKLTNKDNVTVTQATTFKVGNCSGTPVRKTLTITNLTATASTRYNLSFAFDFTLTKLYFEVSADGSNWSVPSAMGTISPQAIGTTISFKYIRISDVSPSGTVYSNVFNYQGTQIVSMPATQLLSFSKTLQEVLKQGTASIELVKELVYRGYSNSFGLAYKSIRITSLPARGSLTVHGVDFTVPLTYSFDDTLEFWPTGSNGQQTFEPFSTSFVYVVIDTSGNESSPVTMNIRFNLDS